MLFVFAFENGVSLEVYFHEKRLTCLPIACLQIGIDSKGQERLRELEPRLDAWNDLELPEGHKDIVQSLIQSHFDKDRSQKVEFDLVHDKGTAFSVHKSARLFS